MSTTVTLIIHGTFAREAAWWRLGSDGRESFADQLERELSQRGLADTVWKPALASGFNYSSFSWSGRNRHRDRVAGARDLSSALNEFAKQVRATPYEPLVVNFVAHSHGGNVVLEALRHLKSNVSVGRIVLLGTPLITTRPAFRAASFVFSAILIALLVIVAPYGFVELVRYLYDPGSSSREEMIFAAAAIPMAVSYAWMLWLVGNLLDVAWRLICRALEPIAWLRRKARLLVYGPSPSKLKSILGGRSILLLTTHNDEADVLLQVGSAPGRLYRAYVGTRFSRSGRVLEFTFLRPFLMGTFFKAVKMLLEIFSLGFSAWRTLVQDFDVLSPADRPYYPANLLVQQRLDIRPKAASLAVSVSADLRQRGDRLQSDAALPQSLYLSVGEITNELIRQIRLRHSAYYDNEAVIVRVADFLAGVQVRSAETTQSSSTKPSPEFWEAFVSANAGLWVLGVCIRYLEGSTPSPSWLSGSAGMVILFGAVFPLIFLGIDLSIAAWRRLPPKPKALRRFWIVWGICALIILMFAAIPMQDF